MPAATGREYAAAVDKAIELTDEIEAWKREIPVTHLPAASVDPERRSSMGTKTSMSAGEAFVASDVYSILKGDGWPRASSPKIQVPEFTKALPTFSVSDATTFPVVPAGRDPEIVRSAEYERLRLRDVISVATTGSDTVQFVKVTSDRPASATGVAPTVKKPESDLALEVASVPVRTLAVWMP